jgi:hypothetical protein
MSRLLLPNVHGMHLIDTLSTNENSKSAIRLECTCGNFLGSLAGLKPLENGRVIVKCEELKLLKPEDTVDYLRRLNRDPAMAGRKGCGRITILSPLGQIEKEFVPGSEDYSKLTGMLDAVREKKENAERLRAWAEQHAQDFQGAAGRVGA